MKTIDEMAAKAVAGELSAVHGMGRLILGDTTLDAWMGHTALGQAMVHARALIATAARIAVEFMQQQDAREGMPGRDPVGLRDPVPGASGSPAQSPEPVTAVAPEREADRGDSRPVEAGAPTEPGG